MERFCMNCGTKLNEGEKFCPNCGANNEEVKKADPIVNNDSIVNNVNSADYNYQAATQPEKTSGLAIASFVCSLVGIIVAGIILGITAICLSIGAKNRMKVFTNEKGKGLATAGLVIGIVDVVFAFIGTIFNVMTLL